MLKKNLKVSALVTISSGLFFISIFLNELTKGKTNHLDLATAILLIFSGSYSYFYRYKDFQILPSKAYGYFCLLFCLLIIIASTLNFKASNMLNFVSLIFGYFAALINLIIGFILITKKS